MGTTEKSRSKMYPGPGSHDLPLFPDTNPSLNASCQYSMGSLAHEATTTSIKKERLGPGAHHPKWFETSTYKRSPGYGFGRQRRPMDTQAQSPRKVFDVTPHSKLPLDDHSCFKKSPQFSFGSKDRFSFGSMAQRCERGTRLPDPGSYNLNDLVTSRMNSPPAYSVSPRREECGAPIKKSKEPGPGSYPSEECHKSIYKAAPRAKFSTAPRGVAEDPGSARLSRSVPGPGQYSSNCTRTSANRCSPAWSMPGRAELDFQNVFL
jgi:hypothetical protein